MCNLATQELSESITCEKNDNCEAFVPKRETCNTANFITISNLGKWRSKTAVMKAVITVDLGINRIIIDRMEVTWGYEHNKTRYPQNIKLYNHDGDICLIDQYSCLKNLQSKLPFFNIDVDNSPAGSKISEEIVYDDHFKNRVINLEHWSSTKVHTVTKNGIDPQQEGQRCRSVRRQLPRAAWIARCESSFPKHVYVYKIAAH